MIAITAEQGTEAWFSARLGKPTGSRFKDVMAEGKGLTRASYRTELALEVVNNKRKESFVSKAMENGTDQEPFARSAYEARTGEMVDEVGFCLHDTLACGVSPDGLVNGSGLTEFKCPTDPVHLEYMKRKDMPPAYRWQVQGQLWVMDREWCDFASYNGSFGDNAQLIIRRTYRDEAAIKSLEESIKTFIEEVAAEVEFIRNYKE